MPHASLISPRDLKPGMRLVEHRPGGAIARDRVERIEPIAGSKGGLLVHLADAGDAQTRRVCLCVDDRLYVTAEVE